ncbi:DUF2508 family protein [Effusibacillus dendaii]|uniref:DUF2508 domain-containing protein n=1 Tax=Effusibacillus dendaii TaxID=2743772 RepID=A0A7I8DBJ0_9BACL|nr:DUF2508 family protein [Effusibacillus dendaii]BCJ87444.1 hypothetical protein skT53_24290 [Effusibacillus dendaii]
MNLNQILNRWLDRSVVEQLQISSEEAQFFTELDLSHREWVLAQERLNYLVDPELIDHAIFVLEAAEKKYSFYLRKAKEKGIRIKIPYPQAV